MICLFRNRSILLASVVLVVGGLSLACFLWINREQRQYAMNQALIDSLREGDFNQSLKLVKSGADPHTKVIPLMAPTWQELLKQLLHRSDPLSNNSHTAFMVVCGDINVDGRECFPANRLHDPLLLPLAQAMLLHGANIKAKDEKGGTALMAASAWGLTDRMALLLEHGALVDLQEKQGWTALHYAVTTYNPEAVKLLLKYHANVHLKNQTGMTPLALALQCDRIEAQNRLKGIHEINGFHDFHGILEIIHLLKVAEANE